MSDDQHPLSQPCRAAKPDGSVVVIFIGWAVFHNWPFGAIANPTPEDFETARQDAMQGYIEANRRELARWLIVHASAEPA